LKAISIQVQPHLAPVRLLRLSCAALLCLAMVPEADEIPRFLDSPSAQELVDLLESANAHAVAHAIAYPPSYSSDELAEDREGVARATAYLMGEFGRLRSVKPLRKQVVILDIGISGGSEAYWWRGDSGVENTRQYIYDAAFEEAGQGFVKVLTYVTGSREICVGFSFGFDANNPEAETRIRAAMTGLMDTMGVPKDHPARFAPLPRWQAPAITP